MCLDNNDTFFSQSKCDRCGQELLSRTMSWFTTETICLDCSKIESELKRKLPNCGSEYEACGFIPDEKHFKIYSVD